MYYLTILAPSSSITDGTDYLSTVRPELRRDYQNPVRTAWTAVRTGLCGTLRSCGCRPTLPESGCSGNEAEDMPSQNKKPMSAGGSPASPWTMRVFFLPLIACDLGI